MYGAKISFSSSPSTTIASYDYNSCIDMTFLRENQLRGGFLKIEEDEVEYESVSGG